MYSTRKEFKAGYISNKRSVWSFRCVTAVWLVCWTLPWRRITSGAKWPTSWTSWLTWAWLDSEWMPASTCGPVTCLLSTVVCTTSTPSGSLVAPGPSSSRRCFFLKTQIQIKYQSWPPTVSYWTNLVANIEGIHALCVTLFGISFHLEGIDQCFWFAANHQNSQCH